MRSYRLIFASFSVLACSGETVDPLGNPYPGYVETDEGLEQGPRPGTARRFVRLPTERKLETLDRPGSKLSGPGYPQRLDMRYLATDTPEVGLPTYEPNTVSIGKDEPAAPAPEEPDVSPYATDEDRKAADDKAVKDSLDYFKEAAKNLKIEIAKEKDPEKKKELQEQLKTIEGEIVKAGKYVPQAASPRPASAGTDIGNGGESVENNCVQYTVDCDGLIENGCETNILTDIENCGSCGIICDGVNEGLY